MVSEFQLLIGNKNYSSWSMRGWLVMKLTGAPFEERIILLYGESSKQTILDFRRAGKVLALKHTRAGETLTVSDSLALGEYLTERFPKAGLLPAGGNRGDAFRLSGPAQGTTDEYAPHPRPD